MLLIVLQILNFKVSSRATPILTTRERTLHGWDTHTHTGIVAVASDNATSNDNNNDKNATIPVLPSLSEAKQEQEATTIEAVNDAQQSKASEPQQNDPSLLDGKIPHLTGTSAAQQVKAPKSGQAQTVDSLASMPNETSINMTDVHTKIFQRVAPWRNSTILPKWMKQYFAWHQEQRAALTADNWNNGTFQFLIVRCILQDHKCGGTADRLKPLPFYMLVAKEMNRILLFWWEKPAPLDAFLVPPEDGLDWRMPDFILEQAGNTSHQLRISTPHMHGAAPLHRAIGYREADDQNPMGRKVDRAANPKEILISTKFQSHGHGAWEYNNLRVRYPYFHRETNQTRQPLNLATKDEDVEPTYEEVFRDCWYSTFIPVPAIQRRMADEMTALGLRKNQFQAIHIRSRYANTMGMRRLKNICRNALHCIYQANPQKAASTPIYVSADHRSAVWATLQYSRELSLPHVTARDAESILALNEKEAEEETSTLHLDRGTNHLARNPKEWTAHHFDAEAYYDTFVDLYVLS